MSEYFKGMALPFGTTIPSVIDPKDDLNVLKTSIVMIVLTGLGERVMLPEFGSPLLDLIFDPNDKETAQVLRDSIKEAIERWDDRITYIDFIANRDDNHLKCELVFKFASDPFRDDTQLVTFDLTEEMLLA